MMILSKFIKEIVDVTLTMLKLGPTWGRSDVVSRIKPKEHFKFDELSRRGALLAEPDNTVKYSWVAA